ncbi:ATP-dependent RNA helicase HrpA [Marinobacterium sp. CAU 1594]|nr:ATP-dependent RNA helicase HrpA [Marinobacterium arenosum]MBY4677891.1 ATP-dependent RNA helicase HrpA [Marinobacterium arenosum]
MNDTLSPLYQQLAHCLIADRRSLEKRLQQAAQRLRQRKPADRMLNAISEQLQQSQESVQQRLAQIGTIDYPDLPISQKRDQIKQAIADNQVVIIAGETGSGKTTQLPKICLELGLGGRGRIGHTQPRRLAARTVASRIAEELHSELGALVGYQVRFTDQSSERTLVKLMTDGILLAETQHDRYLNQYEVLIIDEAHERSLNIDFLLGYLKRILPQRPDLKVIITSATIDLERFSKHFDGAPIIEVSGRTYPVETLYRPLSEAEDEEVAGDQSAAILAAVNELILLERQRKASVRGDILVFLSGEREIRETADYLRKAQLRDCQVLPLYARLSAAEQNKIFHDNRGAGRRIVLATNVAETSLTVPGIRYVIDPGFARISRYSYRSKVQRLPIEPVSQASANQRKGRCGRVAEGICIRLYSEEDFVARPQFTDAEIRRTNLAAVILQMLGLRLGDISEFPFIDPPDSRFINDGFNLLQELGAVDDKRQMTQIGRELSKLPVDPRIGRMVIEAARQDALQEVLIIASALSVQDPRERPADKKQAADEKHRAYAHEESDFLTFVNLWQLYEEQRQELSQSQLRKFCQKQFLGFMRMREWRDIHRQLHIICKELGYRENREPASYEQVHRALLAGLLSHIGTRQENREYLGARNRRFFIFPASMLYKRSPKWLMAAEMVETSRLFARTVARIEPAWVEPLAPHLVKRSYLEPHWEKKRAQVVASEQVTLYGLIIVAKRKVHYGKIDPEASHEIFIRSALVEGAFQTRGKFFQHNRALLADVEELEAKSRRRDLLVDEEQLYQFYHQRMEKLGGGQIVNGAGFEHWRKQVEAEDPQALFMTEDDILQRSAEHVTALQYPDKLQQRGATLKLGYQFEPGRQDDGLSVRVPLPLLKQLPLQRLEWLVPGMIHEKCSAILKGLPKQLRKNFVPIPDYVDALLSALQFGEGDLYEAMALQLKRMTGVLIDADQLRAAVLDDHHRVNIQLLNSAGKQIAQSRDWEALCHKYGDQAEEAILEDSPRQWGRKGIQRWDFGPLAEQIRVRQAGGIEIEAYPTLVDQQDSAELTLSVSAEQARQRSIHGVARLYLLALKEQQRALKGKLPELDRSLILAGGLFERRQLEQQILFQAARRQFQLDQSLPVNEAEFNERLSSYKGGFIETAQELARFVFECHGYYHRIQKRLKGSIDLAAVTVLNDIKQQLAALLNNRYLADCSWEYLKEYPRYLKGIELRLDKYQRELNQQRLYSEQLSAFWQDYQKRAEQHHKQGIVDSELERFRWMLEEYRISLFAQQLGTRMPVSDKRLRQQWQRVQG